MFQKDSQPEQVLLSNGIPVILQHYEGSVAATYWWVRTGSADERPSEAGFAHFLEHMLFKDASAKETGRASSGRTARTIEGLGGDINAYTSFDQTVYHVTCASQYWEKVLDSFGPMAKPQKFLKQDFEREREVILEELRKNEDSSGFQLFQRVFSLTFRRHPYGRPVIGYLKTLKAAKVANLEKFYRRQYVSSRMGLVLVGPLADAKGARRKAILARLEKYFGSRTIPRRPTHPVLRAMEKTVHREPEFETMSFDVQTPTLCAAFRAPELSHADIPALDLLAGILGMGELGRLYQHLFYQKSLVTDTSGGLYVPRDPGMLYFQADLPTMDKINQGAEELFRELKRICEEGPTPEELQRVIVNIESERLYSSQSADGMASRLGFMKFVVDDLDFDRKYLEDLRSVDSARVQEIARRYLDFRRMSGVVMVPKDQASFDPDEISQLARANLDQAFRAEVSKPAIIQKAKLSRESKSEVEVLQMPSGMRVVFSERPQSHVFCVDLAVLGGLRLELGHPLGTPASDWGVSNLLGSTWTKGTTGKDSRAIAHEVEGRAAVLDGIRGVDTIGLSVTGLRRDWAPLSALFNEVLLDASFPEVEIEHSRRVAEDDLNGIEDDSSQLCGKLFGETLFTKHPYGQVLIGSLESLAGIDRAKIAAYHRAWIRPERMVIGVSGPMKLAQVERWAAELERQAVAFAAKSAGPAFPAALADEPELKAPRPVEKILGREQLHIMVGGLGTHSTASDRFAVRILRDLLSGQGGRLFVELREKKSLAYSVTALSFEGLERGYLGVSIACAPSKREQAIQGMRSVLEKLARTGPSASELARAKQYLLGRRAMDGQGDTSLAYGNALTALIHGRMISEVEVEKNVRAVSVRHVQEACRKYLVDSHLVTATVG